MSESDVSFGIGAVDAGFDAMMDAAKEKAAETAEQIKARFESINATFEKVQGAFPAFTAILAGGETFKEMIGSTVAATVESTALTLRPRIAPATGTCLKAKYTRSAVSLCTLSQAVCAAGAGQWVAFDPAYPLHFVDARRIVRVKTNVVRYWDRTGAFPNGDGPDSKYPTYSLLEINCETHMTRVIRMDSALQAGTNARATGDRAKLLEMVEKMQISYPTDWESLEPSPHEYALLEFVCRPRN